jgi:hypothetical protein
VPARLRHVALPKGKREIKFKSLVNLSLADSAWVEGSIGWREPFLPEQTGAWASFPYLSDLFTWSGSGVTAHRVWPISPDVQTLERRWEVLRKENDLTKRNFFFIETEIVISRNQSRSIWGLTPYDP